MAHARKAQPMPFDGTTRPRPSTEEISCAYESLVRLEEYAEKDPAAFATTKAYLRSSTLEQMKAQEQGLAKEWLDAWFSEETRTRISAIVASLGKGKS